MFPEIWFNIKASSYTKEGKCFFNRDLKEILSPEDHHQSNDNLCTVAAFVTSQKRLYKLGNNKN